MKRGRPEDSDSSDDEGGTSKGPRTSTPISSPSSSGYPSRSPTTSGRSMMGTGSITPTKWRENPLIVPSGARRRARLKEEYRQALNPVNLASRLPTVDPELERPTPSSASQSMSARGAESDESLAFPDPETVFPSTSQAQEKPVSEDNIRNFGVMVYRILRTIAQDSFSHQCRIAFSPKVNDIHDRKCLQKESVDAYLANVFSISDFIDDPQFLPRLKALKRRPELLNNLRLAFSQGVRIHHAAVMQNTFYYTGDSRGAYGPIEVGLLRKTANLNDLIIRDEIRGMFEVVTCFQNIMFCEGEKTLEKEMHRFRLTLDRSIEAGQALASDHNADIYRNESVASFETPKRDPEKRSILKQSDGEPRPRRNVRFGGAERRITLHPGSPDETTPDEHRGSFFNSLESFHDVREQERGHMRAYHEAKKRERHLMRMRARHLQQPDPGAYKVLRTKYKPKTAVKKADVLARFTESYENPRTILQMSPTREDEDVDEDEQQEGNHNIWTSNKTIRFRKRRCNETL